MTEGGARAHQFDSAEQQVQSVTLGMWVFLVTEVMFFGGLFIAYVIYRFVYPEAYAAASHHLDIRLGAINTTILLTSSLTMALAVHGASKGRKRPTAAFLALTILLGAVFLGIKAVEYSHKFHEHLVPGTGFAVHDFPSREAELFFSLYFGMTGMHAIHMVIGIVLLAALAVLTLRGRFGPDYYTPVEMTGLYWHFVDIVWIFLFPLFYLIGRHA